MAHPVRPLKTPRPEELSILNAEDGTHFKGVTKMYRGKCLGPETEEKKCGQFCRVQPQGAKISGKLRMGDDLQHCEKKRPLCLREGHRNKAPVGDFEGVFVYLPGHGDAVSHLFEEVMVPGGRSNIRGKWGHLS